MKIAKSETKSIDLKIPFKKAFEYLSNVENWPQWAIVNMISAKRNEDGSFQTKTKFGEGTIRMKPNIELGILDHSWTDPQAHWTVPCRLIPNGEGCTFTITLFQPPNMNESQFRQAMTEMNREMTALKKCAEVLMD